MASVDELKSLVSAKLGFARNNQFLVELPSIGGVSSSEMNILCTRVSLPSKQILSADRRIGMEFEKVAYGYAVDDVTMSFYLLNDYGPRKYFDAWRNIVLDEDTLEVGYKLDYERPVKIHQLRKPLAGLSTNIGPIRLSADIGGGSVYSVELLNAYPTTIQAIDFSNELDGLLEVSVQLSYTNWKPIDASQNFLNFNLSI